MKKLLLFLSIAACLSLPLAAAKPKREPVPAKVDPATTIRQAIETLEKTKQTLERTKGSHKKEALKSCDEALVQLRKALETVPH